MDISQGETNTEVVYGDGEFITRIRLPNEVEETFYNLIDKEQWDMILEKSKAIHDAFPTGTFVTIKKETKEVIAVASATPSHPGQTLVGTMIVRQDHRKQGHGMRIMKALIDQYPGHTLTLTAAPGTEYFYSKLGFREIEPTHEVYYIQVDRSKVDKAYSDYGVHDDVTIECYTKELFSALYDYDTDARGYDCKNFLPVMTGTSSHFLVATSKSSGQVVGYSSGVDQSDLLFIEGMYADSDIIALCIFRKMLQAFPQKTEVKIETIKPREFLVGFGKILPKSMRYSRMSTGPTADVPLSKLYAVTDCAYTE